MRELIVGVATPSDLAGSILVEILHSAEGRDVEQVCSNLEIILLCLRLLISLSLVFISCMILLFISICLIHLVLNWYMIEIDCLLILVFNQESHNGTDWSKTLVRSTGNPNGLKYDRWPVDLQDGRPTGQSDL